MMTTAKCAGLPILVVTWLLTASAWSRGLADHADHTRVRYEPLAAQALESVHAASVLRDVRRLDSVDADTRRAAIDALRSGTGFQELGVRYDPLAAPQQNRPAIEQWHKYAVSLEEAMQSRVRILTDQAGSSSRDRENAAGFLGLHAPHAAWLPLLREIVANDDESYAIRHAAITSITLIPHDELIPYLIEQLDDPTISGRAHEQLRKLVGHYEDRPTPTKEEYLRWWTKHRHDYQYKRTNMLREN